MVVVGLQSNRMAIARHSEGLRMIRMQSYLVRRLEEWNLYMHFVQEGFLEKILLLQKK